MREFWQKTSPYHNLRKGKRYPVPFIYTTTKDDRTGPQRLTGGGLAKPQHVKYAAFASFAVAAVAGIALSLVANAAWFILVGALCIAGAWFYTGGKNPYGYRGLGEVAIFIFFI